MKAATWNVNCWNPGRRRAKHRLLELEEWDVALLQEVCPATFGLFTGAEDWPEREETFTGVSGVELAGGAWDSRSHGAAVLVRSPNTITDAGTVPLGTSFDATDRPTAARAVWATIESKGSIVTVLSAHTRNAAGDGPAAKRAHYETITAWVSDAPRPLIVGIDTNSWADRAEPASDEVLTAAGDFECEQRFLDPGADHGLRDAELEFLTHVRPQLLERRKALGAVGDDGALSVTFQRSNNMYPKANRMDRVLVSEPYRVRDVRTLLGDAYTVGSDHAMVIAELQE